MKKNIIKLVVLACILIILGIWFFLFASNNKNDDMKVKSNDKVINKTDSKDGTEIDGFKFSDFNEKGYTKGINVSYKDDKVYLNIDNSLFADSETNAVTGSYEIEGISKDDIKQYIIERSEDNYYSTVVFFLLNDGTIRYVKLFDNNSFVTNLKTEQDILSTTDAVKLYDAKVDGENGYRAIICEIIRNGNKYYTNLSKEIRFDSNNNLETKTLDLNKCLNCTSKDDVIYTALMNNIKSKGIDIAYKDENVLLNVDRYLYANGISKLKTGNYLIKSINKSEIKNVLISVIGQYYSSDMVFFLNNDGTIKYFRIFNTQGNANINDKCYNAISINELNNISKIYAASVTPKTGVGGYATVIAELENGDFYNLNSYVKE